MNINKKLGRVKQWAGEKMGAESKTGVSDEFRNLETEMQLRHEGRSTLSCFREPQANFRSTGMEKLQKSTTGYIKSMSKRNEGEDREKILPVARLGLTMANHGDDFEPDSEFGNCLIGSSSCHVRLGIR